MEWRQFKTTSVAAVELNVLTLSAEIERVYNHFKQEEQPF